MDFQYTWAIDWSETAIVGLKANRIRLRVDRAGVRVPEKPDPFVYLWRCGQEVGRESFSLAGKPLGVGQVRTIRLRSMVNFFDSFCWFVNFLVYSLRYQIIKNSIVTIEYSKCHLRNIWSLWRTENGTLYLFVLHLNPIVF